MHLQVSQWQLAAEQAARVAESARARADELTNNSEMSHLRALVRMQGGLCSCDL